MAAKDKTSIQKPIWETVLAIAAGFSFYVLCMILPLVGPAGSRVAHAAKNQMTFLTVLAVTLALAGASVYMALRRRRREGGRLPLFCISLGVLCILFLLLTLFDGFAI